MLKLSSYEIAIPPPVHDPINQGMDPQWWVGKTKTEIKNTTWINKDDLERDSTHRQTNGLEIKAKAAPKRGQTVKTTPKRKRADASNGEVKIKRNRTEAPKEEVKNKRQRTRPSTRGTTKRKANQGDN